MGIPKFVIAIDPSINNCGLAVYEGKKLIDYQLLQPTKGLKKSHYLTKCRDMVSQITFYYQTYRSKGLCTLVTEIPQHFGAAGYLARESGSVFKLTFICGMIYNIAPDTIGYEPQEWKGQLPKCVVRARLSQEKMFEKLPLYGDEKIKCPDCERWHMNHDMDHNILDAIAIGYKHIYGRV